MAEAGSATLARLKRFEGEWLAGLQTQARVTFACAELEAGLGSPAKTADTFVSGLGLTAIGYNWELLDASSDAEAPRSALAELTSALGQDINNPNQPWLAPDAAGLCAQAFLGAFEPWSRTIVSNRYDGLWNPISGAAVEWGFAGFDDSAIALLLITGD